jgi:hypothetical protein
LILFIYGGLFTDLLGDTINSSLMRSAALTRRFGLLVFLLILYSLPALGQEVNTVNPLPVFEFHSGFWLNLHHTLYREARLRRDSPSSADNSLLSGLSPSEQRIWKSAVSYYLKNYAGKDLYFSLEMVLIKNQLGDFETCPDLAGLKRKSCDAGLPQGLTEALDSAAPIYRAHLWPEHDRMNRRWIFTVAPLVRRNGLGLSHRLAEIYQTDWPKYRIRVDVTAYANAEGAYTTLDPLRVTISSTDSRNQGTEGLEVLFHEASLGISDNVQDAIIRECHQRNIPIPRDLWHALLFYTAGEVIRSAVPAPKGPGVTSDGSPASISHFLQERLDSRGWHDYYQVLSDYWQPYLDGNVGFEDAIAHMVSAL